MRILPCPMQAGSHSQLDVPNSTNTLTYISQDQLGGVSLTTNYNGTQSWTQEYDPWGGVRSGGTIGTQTPLNYTGQHLDVGTGLLNYNARLYDPNVGRFVSPDSIVPQSTSNCTCSKIDISQKQNTRLTVDFHASVNSSSLAAENRLQLEQGFWFQFSDQTASNASAPWGPSDPRSLNRYTYVVDNPVHNTDPTGHVRKPNCDNGQMTDAPIPLGDGYYARVDTWNTGSIARGTYADHFEIHVYRDTGRCLQEVAYLDENGWGGKHGFPRGTIPPGIPSGLLPALEDLWNKKRGDIGLPPLPVIPIQYGPPDNPLIPVAGLIAIGWLLAGDPSGGMIPHPY